MRVVKKADHISKSLFYTTIIIIIYSSINTSYLNIGAYSFLLILGILLLSYYVVYRILNFISFKPISLSSFFILLYISNTIYSSIPIYFVWLYFLVLFFPVFYIIKREILKSVISILILVIISYFYFSKSQLEVESLDPFFKYPKGKYKFSYLTYSPGEDRHRDEYKNPDIISYKVNVEEILDSDWNQSKIKWREQFWGFNKENIPLNGRLWVPEAEGKFPIISIIHGNHSMQEFSDDGYNFLGEFFAEHGYIFNSLDQNFLNGSWTGDFRGKEMSTRAWHFLENLKYLKMLDSDSTSNLFNKIDFENVIIIGHSRGGEAVNIAAKFNKLKRFPDNGNIKFDYNFDIKGIVTIAPTDYRYFRNYRLQNINYLSIHGGMDSDEESFFGIRQSNRLSNSESFSDFNILIEGANHSQFNSSWGKDDSGFPSKYLLNNRNILPGFFQKKLLTFYLYNFINFIVNEDKSSFEKLIKSINYPIKNRKSKKIISRFKKGGSRILHDFEVDEILESKESLIDFSNTKKIKLEPINFRGGKEQQNNSLYINSSDSTSMTIDILNNEKQYKNLIFDISNENDSSSIYVNFLDDEKNNIFREDINVFNTKIDLDNFKFEYLTKERFKKVNDINFSTYYVQLPNKKFKFIEFKISKGEYYIDNISLAN